MKKPSKPRLVHSKYFKFFLLALFLILAVVFWSFYQSKQTELFGSQQHILQKEFVSQEQALKIVGGQNEVKNYLKEVPDAKIEIDHFEEETNSYVIQVFEVKDGHTNTFNWYEVNKQSGGIKQLFP